MLFLYINASTYIPLGPCAHNLETPFVYHTTQICFLPNWFFGFTEMCLESSPVPCKLVMCRLTFTCSKITPWCCQEALHSYPVSILEKSAKLANVLGLWTVRSNLAQISGQRKSADSTRSLQEPFCHPHKQGRIGLLYLSVQNADLIGSALSIIATRSRLQRH